MRISYDKSSDSLRIIMTDKEADDYFDVGDGLWLHTDEWHNICGIELTKDASKKVDLSRLDVEGLPKKSCRGGFGGEGML